MEKTVVVTGANSGLGLACCEALLAENPRLALVMAGRSPRALESEAAALRQRHPGARITVEALDLARLASVRDFAARIGATYPGLGALVCNAGVQFATGYTFGETGAELTFSTNHLGHFLLANLLLGHMAADGRIIFVASGTHDPAQRTGMPPPRIRTAAEAAYPQDAAEPDSPGVRGRRAYTTSKLCNVLAAYEMDRRLRALGRAAPTVNAFDPGLMPGTGLARTYPAVLKAIWLGILPALLPLVRRLVARGNAHTPQESGVSLAWLAIDGAAAGVTGRYFEQREPVPSSAASHDGALARDLWELSVQLTGLRPEESPLARPAAASAVASHG